jgi:hypothetical protein
VGAVVGATAVPPPQAVMSTAAMIITPTRRIRFCERVIYLSS